jgi:hypothetical protein
MNQVFLSKGFWLCVLVSLAMGSCKNGCTFSRVIKSKERIEKVAKKEIIVKASLLKSRNVKYTLRTNQFSRSGAYYSVLVNAFSDSINLTLDWYFPAEKNEDLKPYLEKTKMLKSADNRFFELSYDNAAETKSLFQILPNGAAIRPIYAEDYLKGKYSLNNLPSDKVFIDQLLDEIGIYQKTGLSEKILISYFKGLNLTDDQLSRLLKHFKTERTALANAYFDDDKLKSLARKSPRFKTEALDFAMEIISDKKNSTQSGWDAMLRFMLVLEDRKSLAQADILVFDAWESGFDASNAKYIRERIKNKKIPVANNTLQKLENRAKTSIDAALAGNKYKNLGSPEFLSQENAAMFMLWTENRAYIDKYVNVALKSGNGDSDYIVDQLVDDFYPFLSTQMKQRIVSLCKNKFEALLAKNNELDASRWYNILHKTVPCTEAKILYKKFNAKFSKSIHIKSVPNC